MVMLTPAEKRESQRQQKTVWNQRENNQAKPKKAQVPDAPEAHAGVDPNQVVDSGVHGLFRFCPETL